VSDGMPVETLELIQQTAQKAQEAQVLDIPGDGRMARVKIGSEVKEYYVQPKPRSHQVNSLQDLIHYVDGLDTEKEGVKPVVWYSHDAVVLVIDDEDRRDTVTFRLKESDAFAQLRMLDSQKPALDQRSFIRLLRTRLGVDAGTVAQFRKLTWQNGSRTAAEVSRGGDRMGREINAQVDGIGDLPEELSIGVPVYDQQGERETYWIRCLLDYDTVGQKIEMVPAPAAIAQLIDEAQASICRRLTEALEIPVYYGKP